MPVTIEITYVQLYDIMWNARIASESRNASYATQAAFLSTLSRLGEMLGIRRGAEMQSLTYTLRVSPNHRSHKITDIKALRKYNFTFDSIGLRESKEAVDAAYPVRVMGVKVVDSEQVRDDTFVPPISDTFLVGQTIHIDEAILLLNVYQELGYKAYLTAAKEWHCSVDKDSRRLESKIVWDFYRGYPNSVGVTYFVTNTV